MKASLASTERLNIDSWPRVRFGVDEGFDVGMVAGERSPSWRRGAIPPT